MSDYQQPLMEHLKIFGVAFFFSIVNSWIAYKKGYFHFALGKRKTHGILTLKDVVGAFIVFLSIQLILVPLIAVLFLTIITGDWREVQKASLDLPSQGWFNVFAMVFAACGVIAYSRYFSPQAVPVIWGEKHPKRGYSQINNITFGFLTWFICYPIVVSLGQVMSLILYFVLGIPEVEQVAVKSLKMTANYPFLFSAMICAVIVFVPVVEELLFRGYLQTWLKDILGRKKAIGISSAIFALFHYSYSQGLSNIEFMLALFILSCFLGFIYERQGSLWAPIGLHVLFNAISVLVIIWS